MTVPGRCRRVPAPRAHVADQPCTVLPYTGPKGQMVHSVAVALLGLVHMSSGAAAATAARSMPHSPQSHPTTREAGEGEVEVRMDPSMHGRRADADDDQEADATDDTVDPAAGDDASSGGDANADDAAGADDAATNNAGTDDAAGADDAATNDAGTDDAGAVAYSDEAEADRVTDLPGLNRTVLDFGQFAGFVDLRLGEVK